MGQHKLNDLQALKQVEKALNWRQKKYGDFNKGDKIVLEKEKIGWHCYYECLKKGKLSKPVKETETTAESFNTERANND